MCSAADEDDFTGESDVSRYTLQSVHAHNCAQYPYDETPPKYPILRVFAAYENTYNVPDTTPGTMGRYPLALLTPQFIQGGREFFSGMDAAVENAKKTRAQQARAEREARAREAASAEKFAAMQTARQELDEEILRAAE